jgi:hypothetical protein
MTAERIGAIGATVLQAPEREEVPTLIASIVRLWAELAVYDRDLALELARKLPTAAITRDGGASP